MIGRVTHQTVQRTTLSNLQNNLSAMSELQNKLSGNRNISKPSDDPAGTATAMALRSALNANEQHSRNISDANGWLTAADTAMQTSLDALRRARDLTLQGANTGVLNGQAREALAVEIEGLRDTLLNQANATYLGRSVFAGTAAGSAVTVTPADPAVPGSTRTYTANGFAGATVERRIDADTVVRVDVDGATTFGAGDASVFATLDRIASTLRSGGDVRSDIGALDAHRDTILREVAGLGARHNQVLSAETRSLDIKSSLAGQLSAIEDPDFAGTIVDLQLQEVAYKAALGAASRVMQPTLLDFLR